MPNRNLVPMAPIDSVIDPSVNLWVTVFMATAAVGALLFSLYHWRRYGRPVFLMLFLSGGAMMVVEPIVDTVGACWFPENSWIAFRGFGRPMPVWLCLCYFFYFGIGIGVVWLLVRRGLTAAQLWLIFAVGMCGDWVMEETLLHFDTWIYYGSQPLVLLKFPFWWAPVNALITMACATLIDRHENYFFGSWRVLLLIPAALSVSTAVNAVAGWPAWFVINSNVGWLATQLAGIAVFALAFWMMSLIVAYLSPGRITARTKAASDGMPDNLQAFSGL